MNLNITQVIKARKLPTTAKVEDTPLESLRASSLLVMQVPSSQEGVSEFELTIPARDGYAIKARVHQPEPMPNEQCPLYVMFHGGAFVLGDASSENYSCRLLSRDLGFVCLNVEHRLAPEYPFPIRAERCMGCGEVDYGARS